VKIIYFGVSGQSSSFNYICSSYRGTRAVGVEYTNDIISEPDSDQSLKTAEASKLVVVSAGAFGSPTILERSGIGAKRILDEAGVKQLVDLPGVGENYQGKFFSLTTGSIIYWRDSQIIISPFAHILLMVRLKHSTLCFEAKKMKWTVSSSWI
jgi:choline dehydrogenase-like flavoprotein